MESELPGCRAHHQESSSQTARERHLDIINLKNLPTPIWYIFSAAAYSIILKGFDVWWLRAITIIENPSCNGSGKALYIPTTYFHTCQFFVSTCWKVGENATDQLKLRFSVWELANQFENKPKVILPSNSTASISKCCIPIENRIHKLGCS